MFGDATAHVPGEVHLRSPSLMAGYYPELDGLTPEGELATGDPAELWAELDDQADTLDEELDAAIQTSINEKGAYDARLYLSWSSDTDYVSNERGSGMDD